MIPPVFLMGVFWEAVILVVVFVPLVFLWLFTLADLFLRRDLSGWAKAGWLLLIIWLPIFGTLIYFFVRPQEELDVLMAPPAEIGPGTADQLEKAAQLRDAGAISEAEFAKLKAKLLG